MDAASRLRFGNASERSGSLRPDLSLACLAGAAGIAYELSWTHALSLVAGNSTRALSMVLAVLLAGMAAGGAIAGRGFLARRQPGLALAGLELLLGAIGVAWPSIIPFGSDAMRALMEAGTPKEIARGIVLAGVLLPPALLLGATFPLWVRLLARSRDAVGRTAALVAGVQVSGAALGAFLTGFVIVPALGFAAASQGAGFADLLVAAVLALRARRTGTEPGPDAGLGAAPAPAAELAPSRRRRLALAFVLAGTASLGFQTVWTRTLVFFLDGLHFAFAAVLTTCLAGMGIGALLVAALAPRVRRPEVWLSATQVLAAVSGLAALAALPLLGGPAAAAARAGEAWPLRVFGLSAALLVVPAAGLGATLPLATWIAVRGGGGLAAALGRAYGQVTLGNAIGALAFPLAVVPLLGLRRAWIALAAASALAAMLLAAGRRGRIAAAAAAVLALGGFAWDLASPRPPILDSHVFRGRLGRDRELLESSDGESCSVAVVRDLKRRSTALYTDTFAAAATGREYPYMRLLGHLPALFCARPERCLVICFGTGTTAGALALHPEVRRLRLVDVERKVFDAAPRFREVNHGVLEGRRDGLAVETAVEDGRLDLAVSDGTWDVISLEPLLPYTPAAATFYSEEFHRLARSKLAPGGVYCHWLPVHAVPLPEWRALLKTFFAAFPEGQVSFFEQSALLWARAGGAGPQPWSAYADRARSPAVLADLREALVEGPEDLLAAWLGGRAEFAEHLADVAVMRDDLPFVAFLGLRPESLPGGALAETLELLAKAGALAGERRSVAPAGVLLDVPSKATAEIPDLRRLRLDLLDARALEAAERRAPFRDPEHKGFRPDVGMRRIEEAILDRPGHLEGRRLLDRLGYLLANASARHALGQGRPLDVLSLLGAYAGFAEWDTGSESLLALALVAAGDGDGALAIVDATLADHPRDVEALVVRAAALHLAGRGNDARAAAAQAEALDASVAERHRAAVEAARAAARQSGLPPFLELRRRLEKLLEKDLLAGPESLEAALADLGRAGAGPLLALLAHPYARRLEAGPESPAGGSPGLIEAFRAAALLGFGRARDALARLEATLPEGPERVACRRARAALVPRSAAEVATLMAGDDLPARRILVAFAASRGTRDVAAGLLPGLRDSDADVRLYTDRALRQLTSQDAGYDYLASESARAAAAARWQALLRP